MSTALSANPLITEALIVRNSSKLTLTSTPIFDSATSAVGAEASLRGQLIHVDTAALSVAQLHSLLDRERFTEYWEDGLLALGSALSTHAASIVMFDRVAGIEKGHVRAGELPTSILQQLTTWEQRLGGEWGAQTRFVKPQTSEWISNTGAAYLALHIPVVVDSLVRGAVSLIFDPAFAPTTTQTETIINIVQMFAISGWRASYLRSYQQRLEHSYLGYTVLQQLTSSLDVKTVLDYAIQSAITMLHAEAATLFRADADPSKLVFMVTKGSVADELKEHRIPSTKGVVGHVFSANKPLVVNDLRNCEWFDSSMDSQTGFVTRNIACVPLRLHGRIIGVLEVLNRRDNLDFTEEDLHWLQVIGEQVAVTLYNAELYQSLRREQERLVKAEEEVRHNLARDLHDNTAQVLSLAIMRLDWAQKLLQQGKIDDVAENMQEIEQLARQANREVRTLLFELRPLILESKGLIPAIEAYHKKLTTTLNCAVHLDVKPPHFDVDADIAIAVFNIIQEAVNNVRKHANASNIWIRLFVNEDKLGFEVEDDGEGFNHAQTMASYGDSGSHGLLNMQERATMLGGNLEIRSPRPTLTTGTLICGTVPLRLPDANATSIA